MQFRPEAQVELTQRVQGIDHSLPRRLARNLLQGINENAAGNVSFKARIAGLGGAVQRLQIGLIFADDRHIGRQRIRHHLRDQYICRDICRNICRDICGDICRHLHQFTADQSLATNETFKNKDRSPAPCAA